MMDLIGHVLGAVACLFVLGLFASAVRWLGRYARREAAKAAEDVRVQALWDAWRAYHEGCTFCRLTEGPRRIGSDEQERVDLGFTAGFVLGYGTRDHRAHGTRPREWALCPRHHKDAVALSKMLKHTFHVKAK